MCACACGKISGKCSKLGKNRYGQEESRGGAEKSLVIHLVPVPSLCLLLNTRCNHIAVGSMHLHPMSQENYRPK